MNSAVALCNKVAEVRKTLPTSPIEQLAALTLTRLRQIGVRGPSKQVLKTILETLYGVSLRTEEGRQIRCSVAFSDPSNPDPDRPRVQRVDYPKFSRFTEVLDFSIERLVKLSRAINPWAASIAIYGSQNTPPFIWGVLDQRVHYNMSLYNERGAPIQPGVFTAEIDGIGQLSVYHESVFLGALKYDTVITEQIDALYATAVLKKVRPNLSTVSAAICAALNTSKKQHRDHIARELRDTWVETVQRICIGVQRAGTGGTIIITGVPPEELLSTGYTLEYGRPADAVPGAVLQSAYKGIVADKVRSAGELVPRQTVVQESFADGDADDRLDEVTGCVRLLTSLATLDGALVLNTDLSVKRFGAKINSNRKVRHVYDGASYLKTGQLNKTFDYTRHGTRHLSVIRYCLEDPTAIGIIVSQDGAVRVVTKVRASAVLWDNVKLRQYHDDLSWYRNFRKIVAEYRRKGEEKGYTPMPKTTAELLEGLRHSTNAARRSYGKRGGKRGRKTT